MLESGRSYQCGTVRRAFPAPSRPTGLTDTVLQKEPDGVMTVKFRDPIGAQACVLVRTAILLGHAALMPSVTENAWSLFLWPAGGGYNI